LFGAGKADLDLLNQLSANLGPGTQKQYKTTSYKKRSIFKKRKWVETHTPSQDFGSKPANGAASGLRSHIHSPSKQLTSPKTPPQPEDSAKQGQNPIA
jgi:hypothetical protein